MAPITLAYLSDPPLPIPTLCIGDCVTTLRHQTAHLWEDLLANRRAGKTDGVHQRPLNSLVRFIEDFK